MLRRSKSVLQPAPATAEVVAHRPKPDLLERLETVPTRAAATIEERLKNWENAILDRVEAVAIGAFVSMSKKSEKKRPPLHDDLLQQMLQNQGQQIV